MVVDTAGVGIEHTFLVQSRHVGNWNIFHCICCKMDTHAVPDSTRLPFLLNPILVVFFTYCSVLFKIITHDCWFFLKRLILIKSQSCNKVKDFLLFTRLFCPGLETLDHLPQETSQVNKNFGTWINRKIIIVFFNRQGIPSRSNCCHHPTNDV